MSGADKRQALVDHYERIRREVAGRQAVDAAEDILGNAWVEQLGRMRHDAAVGVCVQGETVGAARVLMRTAESEGDARQVACARALLARAERDLEQSLADTRRTLTDVENQLQALGRVTRERMRRRQSDAQMLRAAYTAALDAGDAER
jgi:hypothetical protein